jgi:hypothetical protein
MSNQYIQTNLLTSDFLTKGIPDSPSSVSARVGGFVFFFFFCGGSFDEISIAPRSPIASFLGNISQYKSISEHVCVRAAEGEGESSKIFSMDH